jgi:hypothetical protein
MGSTETVATVSTDVTAEVALALRRRADLLLDDEEPDDGGRVAVQLELERPAPGLALRAGLQVREPEQRPDVVPEGSPAGQRRRVPGLAERLEPEQHLAALPPPRAPQADRHRPIIGSHVAGGRGGAGGRGRAPALYGARRAGEGRRSSGGGSIGAAVSRGKCPGFRKPRRSGGAVCARDHGELCKQCGSASF